MLMIMAKNSEHAKLTERDLDLIFYSRQIQLNDQWDLNEKDVSDHKFMHFFVFSLT